MNLLEIYLKEIHEVKPYNEDWCKEFPDREFVEVTATWECYGRITKNTEVFNTKMWSAINERGYYLG